MAAPGPTDPRPVPWALTPARRALALPAGLTSTNHQPPGQVKNATPAAALAARDRLALAYLGDADALARAHARRLAGLTLAEQDDLRQVAREALLRAAARVQPGADPLPYLRCCIAGALRQYLRDRVRLVRIPRAMHEAGTVPLGHDSLNACPGDGSPEQIETLAAPEAAEPIEEIDTLAHLVDQLPAADAAALRLTVLQGLSLRQAAAELGISAMTVQRARARALAALRRRLEA